MNSGESGCTRAYRIRTRSVVPCFPAWSKSDVTSCWNLLDSSTILSSMVKEPSEMSTCMSYGRRAKAKSKVFRMASASNLSGLSSDVSDLYIEACSFETVNLNSKDF